MSKPPAPSSGWIVTTVYLTNDLTDRIAARRSSIAKKLPGMHVTASEVIRNALDRGLTEIEDNDE